jgi:hypothetical protein
VGSAIQNYPLFTGKVGDEFLKVAFSDSLFNLAYIDKVSKTNYNRSRGEIPWWGKCRGDVSSLTYC